MASLILLLSELIRVQGAGAVPASLLASQLYSSDGSATASSSCAAAAAGSSCSTSAKRRPATRNESYDFNGEDLQEPIVCVNLAWP
ncbi:uncharacterized protein J3R85_001912 [Psidium guajava]|nr:uncharacterized protein J3R85_001912 [Psidium guajava]